MLDLDVTGAIILTDGDGSRVVGHAELGSGGWRSELVSGLYSSRRTLLAAVAAHLGVRIAQCGS